VADRSRAPGELRTTVASDLTEEIIELENRLPEAPFYLAPNPGLKT
jgi:hypothetical protein